MIKIHPEIEFSAVCPKEGATLHVKGLAVPGMYSLAEASCPVCRSEYYVDLPVGHAVRLQAVLDKDTGDICNQPESVALWYSSILEDGYSNQSGLDVIPKVTRFFDAKSIVVVNCLDFIYGHSLLKLLNVQRHLYRSPELGCCVLIQPNLAHLVPEGVAEIWEFPLSFKDGWKWHPTLQRWFGEYISGREECFLSRAYSHPSPGLYDLRRFVRDLPDVSGRTEGQSPVVMFSYREDRLWGRTIADQEKNLQRLYDRLAGVFPEMLFVLTGFGRQNVITGADERLVDLRAEGFDADTDRLWLSWMAASDCVVGVHGSNMLLPSGLARAVVELVPRSRFGNSVQDFLFQAGMDDLRDPLLNYRMLYGNDPLTDVRPSAVVDMVANVLSYSRTNATWFKADKDPGMVEKMDRVIGSDVFLRGGKHLGFTLPTFIKRVVRRAAHLALDIVD